MPCASITQVSGLRRELGDRVICTAPRKRGECGHPVLINSRVVCSHSGCKAQFSVIDLLVASLARIADVIELQQVIGQLKSDVVNELIDSAALGSQPDPWIANQSDWIWSRQAVPVLVSGWNSWAYAFYMGRHFKETLKETRTRLAGQLCVNQRRVRFADSTEPLELASKACIVASELGLTFSPPQRNMYPQWIGQKQIWLVHKESAGNVQYVRPELENGGYLTLFVTPFVTP